MREGNDLGLEAENAKTLRVLYAFSPERDKQHHGQAELRVARYGKTHRKTPPAMLRVVWIIRACVLPR